MLQSFAILYLNVSIIFKLMSTNVAALKLELDRLCFSLTAEVEDFANPIEPSSVGGAKIAAEIVKVVRTHPFESLAHQ